MLKGWKTRLFNAFMFLLQFVVVLPNVIAPYANLLEQHTQFLIMAGLAVVQTLGNSILREVTDTPAGTKAKDYVVIKKSELVTQEPKASGVGPAAGTTTNNS
jgi:hypothetical protein